MPPRVPSSIAQLVLALLTILWTSFAFSADSTVPDPAIEARLRNLSAELRCLVCQNESLADSHAELAADLRREIRTLMVQGKSDQQVIEYLVARYGDFIRFRPPLKNTTYALWFGPFVLAILGSIWFIYHLIRRRRRQFATAPLTEQERSHLDTLLHKQEDRS